MRKRLAKKIQTRNTLNLRGMLTLNPGEMVFLDEASLFKKKHWYRLQRLSRKMDTVGMVVRVEPRVQ